MSVGLLHVSVSEAKLLAKDDVDAYAIVTLIDGDSREERKTKIVKNTKTPKWDFSTVFEINAVKAVLTIQVYSHYLLVTDDFLGGAEFSVEKLCDGLTRNQWTTLLSPFQWETLLEKKRAENPQGGRRGSGSKISSYKALLEAESEPGEIHLKLMMDVTESWFVPSSVSSDTLQTPYLRKLIPKDAAVQPESVSISGAHIPDTPTPQSPSTPSTPGSGEDILTIPLPTLLIHPPTSGNSSSSNSTSYPEFSPTNSIPENNMTLKTITQPFPTTTIQQLSPTKKLMALNLPPRPPSEASTNSTTIKNGKNDEDEDFVEHEVPLDEINSDVFCSKQRTSNRQLAHADVTEHISKIPASSKPYSTSRGFLKARSLGNLDSPLDPISPTTAPPSTYYEIGSPTPTTPIISQYSSSKLGLSTQDGYQKKSKSSRKPRIVDLTPPEKNILESENARLREDLNATRLKLNNEALSVTSYKSKLKEKQVKFNLLKQEYKKLSMEHETSKETNATKLKDANSRIAALEKELKAAKSAQAALTVRMENDSKQAQEERSALEGQLEAQKVEFNVLAEQFSSAEKKIKEQERKIHKLENQIRPGWEANIKKELKLSQSEVLKNVHVMSDGHLFVFTSCCALMQFPEEKKSDERSRIFRPQKIRTHEKRLVIPYKKLNSLERYEHVDGPAIWFHLLLGPINPIKVHGFHNRECAMRDIINAAGSAGISVSVQESE